MSLSYDPDRQSEPAFIASAEAFLDGRDSPRACLERRLETIERLEPVVRGWTALNIEGARSQADASTVRWKAGRPSSPIDGMPLGIKDMLETFDMPTEMGVRGLAGNFPKRDNAAVWALRQAGAVILGKTVTTEYAGLAPSVTTNPFDPQRTPGGSSAGSAAVVGAGMVAVAIGSQVGGSMIRPASYCANYALKPSQGAINRGEAQSKSMLTHGPHAATLEDMWLVAIEIARRAGGDPGFAALTGPASLPTAHRPVRLAMLETDGLANLDSSSRAAFEAVLAQLRSAGVEIVRRTDDPGLEEFEQALAGVSRLTLDIIAWENQWALRNILIVSDDPHALSATARASITAAEQLGVDGYERCLRQRAAVVARFVAIGHRFDAFLSPASAGPAPRIQDAESTNFPTGDPVFNTPSSLLGACALTLPLTSVGDMPMGIQIMGSHGADARITAIGRWLMDTVRPVRT